jgi:hypothetical protein
MIRKSKLKTGENRELFETPLYPAEGNSLRKNRKVWTSRVVTPGRLVGG